MHKLFAIEYLARAVSVHGTKFEFWGNAYCSCLLNACLDDEDLKEQFLSAEQLGPPFTHNLPQWHVLRCVRRQLMRHSNELLVPVI